MTEFGPNGQDEPRNTKNKIGSFSSTSPFEPLQSLKLGYNCESAYNVCCQCLADPKSSWFMQIETKNISVKCDENEKQMRKGVYLDR